jgi:hypothetical protein
MQTIEAVTPSILPEHQDDPRTLHIFMLVKATRNWLELTNAERAAFLEKEIRPLLRAHAQVKLRFFDAEAFTTQASDVLLWETQDMSAWVWICDHLRDTLFWDHYFEVLQILPSLEGNYFAERDEH